MILNIVYDLGGTGSVFVNSSDVGICVKPIHFDYEKTLEMIEFIELNKILGVTKFTFYNHTMSKGIIHLCLANFIVIKSSNLIQ